MASVRATIQAPLAFWFLQVTVNKKIKYPGESVDTKLPLTAFKICREVAGKRGVFRSAYTPAVATAV